MQKNTKRCVCCLAQQNIKECQNIYIYELHLKMYVCCTSFGNFPQMTNLMELPKVFRQKCRMQCNIKRVRKPVLGVGNTGSRRGNTLSIM